MSAWTEKLQRVLAGLNNKAPSCRTEDAALEDPLDEDDRMVVHESVAAGFMTKGSAVGTIGRGDGMAEVHVSHHSTCVLACQYPFQKPLDKFNPITV
jgi:hypothetical protein